MKVTNAEEKGLLESANALANVEGGKAGDIGVEMTNLNRT